MTIRRPTSMTMQGGFPDQGRELGFSLVELMIAMAIGLILVGAMLATLISSTSIGKTKDRAADVQTNGTYALNVLKRELRHAGYPGISPPDEFSTIPAFSVSGACDPASVADLRRPVWGAEDANPFASSCLPPGSYARGDVLMLRRLALRRAAAPLDATVIYYRSGYSASGAFLGNAPPPDSKPPFDDYAVEEQIYYISSYTNDPAESPKSPALYRLRLVAGPAMVRELVAQGVEDMQIRYGRADGSGAVQYSTADRIPADQWNSVTLVEIALLVRSDEIEPGLKPGVTYLMGGKQVTGADSYRRVVFSTVVELRNKQ